MYLAADHTDRRLTSTSTATKPKPFVWTDKASDILEKVKRARATLDND
jgi:hypothetical protein